MVEHIEVLPIELQLRLLSDLKRFSEAPIRIHVHRPAQRISAGIALHKWRWCRKDRRIKRQPRWNTHVRVSQNVRPQRKGRIQAAVARKDRRERPPAVHRCESRKLPSAEEQSLPPVHAGEKWPTGPKRQLHDMAQCKRMGSIKSRRPVLACNVVWSKFRRVIAEI